MRRGQVSPVDLELPSQLQKLSYVPRQPEQHQTRASGRPYRIVRSKGDWFVEFTEGDDPRERPWT